MQADCVTGVVNVLVRVGLVDVGADVYGDGDGDEWRVVSFGDVRKRLCFRSQILHQLGVLRSRQVVVEDAL